MPLCEGVFVGLFSMDIDVSEGLALDEDFDALLLSEHDLVRAREHLEVHRLGELLLFGPELKLVGSVNHFDFLLTLSEERSVRIIDLDSVGLAGVSVVLNQDLDETDLTWNQVDSLGVLEVFVHHLIHNQVFLRVPDHLDLFKTLVLLPVWSIVGLDIIDTLLDGTGVIKSQSLDSIDSQLFVLFGVSPDSIKLLLIQLAQNSVGMVLASDGIVTPQGLSSS